MSRALSVLVVLHEFNAGGVQYAPGDVVADDAPSAWPEGALESRLEHGFVKYAPAHRHPTPDGQSPDGSDAPPPDPAGNLLLLENMTKAELADYAETEFGVVLDAAKLKKEDLLLEVRQLIAEHPPEA